MEFIISDDLSNSKLGGGWFINKNVLMVLVGLLFMIMLTAIVSAPGVTPAYYIVDFETGGFEGDFEFYFGFDKGSEMETYVSGDLAEYVELDKDFLEGGGKVIAHLKLPNKIDEYGEHRIRVGAKQLPTESGGIEVIGDVGGIIKVNVPYPGKHLEGDFHISNTNAGEDAEVRLNIRNNGEEGVYVVPIIAIYNSGEDAEEVKVLQFEGRVIERAQSFEYIELLGTSDLNVGDYNASAVIEYDSKELELETGFRVGGIYVKIVDYTKEFERNKVSRFEIDVLSFSNNLIENLYANVTIIDEEVSFLTPSIDLTGWNSGKLEGFFDTTQVKPRTFEAEIVLHYGGEETREIVKLKYAGEISFIWYFIGGGAFALIFGLIMWIARRKQWQIKGRKNLKKQDKK